MPALFGGGKQAPPSWLPQSAEARQTAQRAKRKKAGIATFGIAAVVVFSAVLNPPTGSVHDFTKASDYNPVKESGCTNSGKGCHGGETSYTDFNAYHPNAKCTTCHAYQGFGCIPCHKPTEHECELCHDGTMKVAADVVRLTDPYPRGHYRETTHTAMGTDAEEPVRAAPAGKASAQCKDCHSRDLRTAHTAVAPVQDSPYGRTVGCGECHNDTRSNGLAQVVAQWKGRRCEDCHTKKSSSPMHPTDVVAAVESTSSVGCGATGSGCHESNDVHALHPDTPAKCSGSAATGEPGCHKVGAEAGAPATTACGSSAEGCHLAYLTAAFSHDRDTEVHSPSSTVPASDASYQGVPCGDCHDMAADGRSLQYEHALWTSERTNVPNDTCRDCHNDPASTQAVADGWPGRDSVYGCYDCHGTAGLKRDHVADLSPLHVSDSPGCSSTGPGCHPTSDLAEVGEPTLDANIHTTCLRCHDRTRAGGNQSFDPRSKTCGTGRDCHGGSSPVTSVHDGAGGLVDGADALHLVGALQAGNLMLDSASGLETPCQDCHAPRLGVEHGRPNSEISSGIDTVCVRCHDARPRTAEIVKGNWSAREGVEACAACHEEPGRPGIHSAVDTSHADTELAADGDIRPGACVRSGCHTTTDVRILHKTAPAGCTVTGCHQPVDDIDGRGIRSCGGVDPDTSCHTGYSATSGHKATANHQGDELDPFGDLAPGSCVLSGCHPTDDLARLHGPDGCGVTGCHEAGTTPSQLSCGGPDPDVGCHPGFTAAEHFVDHRADLTGTVEGVVYGAGENVGCFGCHLKDLESEHSTGPAGPSISGGGAGNCRVCHYNADDPGSGAYAGLPAVKAAIAAKDLRCVACHASGSAAAGPSAAASPHKMTTTATPLPAGRVWADPFAEWKAAFEGSTGGGHNVLPAGLVGAAAGKRFPVTGYTTGGTTYTWSLPPNTGPTQWLRTDVYPPASVSTTAGIQGITITCSDCHLIPPAMTGPHGSAVRVYVDPDYSQTEYAAPTHGLTSQFATTGTDRVVCFKCHTLDEGSVAGTTAPGGNAVHGLHALHAGFPVYNPVHYGEKCIDCHVRIPHAWRHQRLLIRAVPSGDPTSDKYPYVQRGHDGLLGVILGDIDGGGAAHPASCVAGGCHGVHNSTTHPSPSDVPGASFWP